MSNQQVSKALILKKSKQLFREKGYSNTSIAMLAQSCELSKSHLYYYFRNKEGLMAEVLNQELLHFTDNVFQVAYEEAYSPKKRLKKLFKAMDNAFCKNATGSLMSITVYQSSVEDGKLFFPIIRNFYDAWERALFQIFSAKYSQKKSRKVSRTTLLQLEGALIFLAMNNDPEPFREVVLQTTASFTKESI